MQIFKHKIVISIQKWSIHIFDSFRILFDGYECTYTCLFLGDSKLLNGSVPADYFIGVAGQCVLTEDSKSCKKYKTLISQLTAQLLKHVATSTLPLTGTFSQNLLYRAAWPVAKLILFYVLIRNV